MIKVYIKISISAFIFPKNNRIIKIVSLKLNNNPKKFSDIYNFVRSGIVLTTGYSNGVVTLKILE